MHMESGNYYNYRVFTLRVFFAPGGDQPGILIHLASTSILILENLNTSGYSEVF